MNANLEKLLKTALPDSERSELGSLLQLNPESLTPRQSARELDLFQGLIEHGLGTFPWKWDDFAPLTSSGRVALVSTDEINKKDM